jgi:hypothetical protein
MYGILKLLQALALNSLMMFLSTETSYLLLFLVLSIVFGHAVAHLVKALSYKPEGHEF